MKLDIINLSKELIKIQTIEGNTVDLNHSLDIIKNLVKDFTVEEFEKNGHKSILVYKESVRPKSFKIILNGHLDVIPGNSNQYSPKVVGNKLYGVGSMDMKSNVVCLVLAFKEVAKKVNYPLGLQIVTDEEIGGFDGTKYQIDCGVKCDFVIAGESTNFNIVNRAKGVLWIKVNTNGITAHGAYPWKGDNAIWKMHKFLTKLKKIFPIPKHQEWISTLNLSRVETSNTAFNKIPDNCSVFLDIRFVPEDKHKILEKLKSIMSKDFTYEVVANESELDVAESNSYLVKLKNVTESITNKETIFYGAQGSSDARHYTAIGAKGIEFGPIGGGIGTDEEWVDIDSLETYYNILVKYLYTL